VGTVVSHMLSLLIERIQGPACRCLLSQRRSGLQFVGSADSLLGQKSFWMRFCLSRAPGDLLQDQVLQSFTIHDRGALGPRRQPHASGLTLERIAQVYLLRVRFEFRYYLLGE
jgi:hypothetical protein